MTGREKLSLATSFLVAVILLGFLLWILAACSGGPSSGAPPKPPGSQEASARHDADDENEVVVALAEAVPPKPDAPPEEPVDASLATSQQGNKERLGSEASERDDSVESADGHDKTTPEEDDQSRIDEPPDPAKEGPVRSDSARPETASPSSESTAGDSDDWRLTLKGGLPPLAYVGDTETLWEKYPRLEMAWILDRDYHDDDARVVWEFVLDTSNQLYWRDLRDPGTSSPGFTYAIRNHVITDRVHVREPQSLRIWQHHARICDVAGLPTTTANRIRWGYYRHRVEAYRLQKAVQVFRQAQEAGRIQFKPHQHSYLQIEWRTDRTGEPQIGKVLFHRASESPAELLP